MAFTSGLTMVIGCGPVMPLPEAPAATVPASDQALTRADSDGLDQPQRHPASAGSGASPASAAAAGPSGPPSAPESETRTPDLANVPQREMPEAAQSKDDPTNVPQAETADEGGFTGVYYNAYFGYLHLVRQGDSVTGRWRTDTGDAWGELTGDIKGNVLRFQWTEHKTGMVGAAAVTKGHGYFVYHRSAKKGDMDLIKGERGLGDRQSGQKWVGVKQRNVVPNLQLVVPNE